MTKQCFQEFNFRTDTLKAIETANAIIAEYEAQGYRLTLRQLYYQHVARGLFPSDRTWRQNPDKRWVRDPKGTPNAEPNYKWLGSIINDGRLAGLIDWDAIEDRTRSLQGLSHWEDPADIIGAAARGFHIDKWENQFNRVEVWIEKEALAGVIERVCNAYDVAYFACRGYTSQSEMYAAAQRLSNYIDNGQDVYILHLGDHDPSGMDMTRDIKDRLLMFLEGMGCDINRLALNWDQIELYGPPPNPAKATDARFNGYQELYGDESWELDALEPAVISDLIEENILKLLDEDRWEVATTQEREHRAILERTADDWPKVAAYLSNGH